LPAASRPSSTPAQPNSGGALQLYLTFLGVPILICGAVVFPLSLLRNPVQSTEAADGR